MRVNPTIMACLCVVAAGCGSEPAPAPPETAAEAPKIVQADEVVTTTQTIPEGFPNDVPLHPEWTVRQVTTINESGTYDVEASISAANSDAVNYLLTEAKAKGWTMKSSNGNVGEPLYMALLTKDDRTLTITAILQDKDVIIHLTTG